MPETPAYQEAIGLEGAEVWSVAAKMKPMAHWVLLPEEYNEDSDQVDAWVRRAHQLAKPAVKVAAKASGSAKARARARAKVPRKAKQR